MSACAGSIPSPESVGIDRRRTSAVCAALASGLVVLLGAGCDGDEAPPDPGPRSERADTANEDGGEAVPRRRLVELGASPTRFSEPLLGTCELDRHRNLGEKDDFGRIVNLRSVDGLLVAADHRLPPYIKILDLGSGRLLATFGEPGDGPGEFHVVSSLFVESRNPLVLGAYGYQNRRISFLRFSEEHEDRLRMVGETPLVNDELGLLGLTRRGEGFIAGGLFADYTLAEIGPGGEVTAELVTDPPFDREDAQGSWTYAALMNSARTVRGPDGLVAVAYEGRAAIDIIDLESETYQRLLGPEDVHTQFEIRDGRLFTGDGHERAYRLLAASEHLLFAGFVGTAFDRAPDGHNPHRILVFDWEGRYLADLELDTGATALAVSEGVKRLWAGYEAPYPQIGEWSLPDPLLDAALGEGDPSEGNLSSAEACSG